MSFDDDSYPEEDDPDDYDSHGEDGLGDAEPDDDFWDDDPWDGIEREPEEPRCPGPGCYDTGSDWRGRRCRSCNPTPWERRRAEWTWSATAPWRWVRRKVRARMKPGDVDSFPPF